MKNEIPEYVIDALTEVYEEGGVNMLNRKQVAALVGDRQSREWLEKASDQQYTNVLKSVFEDGEDGDPGDDEDGDDDFEDLY